MEKPKMVKKILSWVVMIVVLIIGIVVFSKYNFNSYIKAEYIAGATKFTRDSNTKYEKTDSYKIENTKQNDAMFYKVITVKPNTPYKVTAMVKTNEVQKEKNNTDSGANICIIDTEEKSNNIEGTKEWTKIEFIFNSYHRTEVKVGFRLGSYESNCIGTAWFSDFKIEQGLEEESKEWNFLALMYNTDVKLEENNKTKQVKLQLDNTDREDMKTCIARFKNSISELSEGKININYELIEMSDPITTMSYDEKNGYYISPNDMKETIDSYVKTGKYDHVFVIFKSNETIAKENTQVTDWIGLGGMEYRNIGFSNIRLPNSTENLIYKYDYRYNLFPEEVFLHEFLHTLERNSQKYGYARPALHDYAQYGYKEESLIGQKKWYADYMNSNISSEGQKIGLNKEIYIKKPAKESAFEYSLALDSLKEPSNIIEVINIVIKKVITLFENIGKTPMVNTIKS